MEGLVVNDIPDGLRNALSAYLGALSASAKWELARALSVELDLPDLWDGNLAGYVLQLPWHVVLDLLEATYLWHGRHRYQEDQETFRGFVNTRLLRYYSAYSMNNGGRIVDPGSTSADKTVQEARALLRDARFSGPDRQFQEAIDAFQRRPSANYELAVSQAWTATEGVARIVLNEPKFTLGEAMKRIQRDHTLHAALVNGISSLYGYASDEAGRHGLIGEPRVDRILAEYALHHAAAAIVLMARLYGGDVIQAS